MNIGSNEKFPQAPKSRPRFALAEPQSLCMDPAYASGRLPERIVRRLLAMVLLLVGVRIVVG